MEPSRLTNCLLPMVFLSLDLDGEDVPMIEVGRTLAYMYSYVANPKRGRRGPNLGHMLTML